MDSYLLNISDFFINIAFLGIPFSLLGMLLLLGFQFKHPISIIISLIGITGISFFTLGWSIEGLVTGEVPRFSRYLGVIKESENPTGYWITTGLWLSLSLLIFGCCGWVIFRVTKKYYEIKNS